jgi:hypothetical protein
MTVKGKTKIIAAMILITVFLLQNCATIIRGTSQNIPVTSNPIGAKITVNGEELGYTPLNLRLKRKKSCVIWVEKQGYNLLEIRILRKTSSFYLFWAIYFGAFWVPFQEH